MGLGDVRAKIGANTCVTRPFYSFAPRVETHLRAASTWGFDIPDVAKRGDVSAK